MPWEVTCELHTVYTQPLSGVPPLSRWVHCCEGAAHVDVVDEVEPEVVEDDNFQLQRQSLLLVTLHLLAQDHASAFVTLAKFVADMHFHLHLLLVQGTDLDLHVCACGQTDC